MNRRTALALGAAWASPGGSPAPLARRPGRCGWSWPSPPAGRPMSWRASWRKAWAASSASRRRREPRRGERQHRRRGGREGGADGAALLYNTSSIAISRALYRKLAYDLLQDLAPVALTASSPLALVVNPAMPPRDPAGFIAWAGESGQAQLLLRRGRKHLPPRQAFLALRHLGAEAVHVPYRGTAAALTDTAAGNVQFTRTPSSPPCRWPGRPGAGDRGDHAERSPLLPEVPSMARVGPARRRAATLGTWQGIWRRRGPARGDRPAECRGGGGARGTPSSAPGWRRGGGADRRHGRGYAALSRQRDQLWARVVRDSGATAE